MTRKFLSLISTGMLIFALAACNFSTAPQGGATPTIQAIPATSTPLVEMTLTATSAPTLTLDLPQVASPTPTETSAPPTITPTVTDTPGPYEHTMKSGETLGYIIQQYGYTDLSVAPGSIIAAVVALNDNVPSADILPGDGSVILIPRQTSTPTPASTEAAVVMQATNAAEVPNVQFSPETTFSEYTVQEGDTIISIAGEFNLTIEQIAVLNTDLNVFGCNFEIPSGGPNCNIPLQIGQVIKYPAPTPTPTLSPTPSGNETPTPTPTYAAPILVYPPQGAVAQPGVFTLQWVGVGVLQPNQVYLVEVVDTTTANAPTYRQITRNTSLPLPDSLIPSDGQVHTFNWTVRVAAPNDQGVYQIMGGTAEVRIFQWQSR
ncbi:MAG: LysM peptidoglycan-binding domain-containing protein [Chloroflexota bacterium]